MRKIIISLLLLSALKNTSAQDMPNTASIGNTSSIPAGKLSSNPVNLFTGRPNVNVPIYSFQNNNGLSLNISLDYLGGGVQMSQEPTAVGLNWYLNVGGSISRSVRGLPDDFQNHGFINASAIPTDFRSNGDKYYYDTLDSEQDVFYYNFDGHGGKFFMGKNGQIAVVPSSRIKIIPTYGTISGQEYTLQSFRIVAENGIKYDFLLPELTRLYVNSGSLPSGYAGSLSGYIGKYYPSSWKLSRIISPFNSDTINFHYTTKYGYSAFAYPQVTFVRNTDGVRTATYKPTGSGNFESNRIDSISFPDKTKVKFVYSLSLKYNDDDYALSKINIYDTAFRYGYLLEYLDQINAPGDARMALIKVTPFTPKEKNFPYAFAYWNLLPKLGSENDTLGNKVDHWGYYNSAINGDNQIPKIGTYSWGANRDPSQSAYIGTLSSLTIPEGGSLLYGYELNDHAAYTKGNSELTINATTTAQNTLILSQVYNTKQHLVFMYKDAQARQGASPVSGPGNLICDIKNSAGTITYATCSLSLNDLFYTGFKSWDVNLPNGIYLLETQLSSGTSVSGTFNVNLLWETKDQDTSQSIQAGGIRVNSVIKNTGSGWAEIEYYKYILSDGKSSGFFGDIPRYDYPYKEIVNYGGSTTTNYTLVGSQPVSTMDYAHSSPVGYSRVEVHKGIGTANTGKIVYEFTDLKDVNTNSFATAFPYHPADVRSWGLGMPKKVSVYDTSGALIKRTVNTYQFDTLVYNTDNFKSLKLGHVETTYNGNPALSTTPRIRTYIGEHYYATGGHSYLVSTADSLFQADGSINATTNTYTYDTNYNVIKIVSGYDRSRGLQKETRLYYPYNYTTSSGLLNKFRDSGIISQVVSNETWITGDSNPRILDGTITAFKQISSNELKTETVYAFQSNKPIPQSTIGLFDPSTLNRSTTYFKPQADFTVYDAKGNSTEIQSSITSQSNSVIMDYNSMYPVAKVSNALQSDIAYTSFEADGSGNWIIGSTARDNTQALTGKKSYNLSNGNVSKSGLSSSQSYIVTLWVKTGASASVNGTSLSSSIATQNGWNLYLVNLTSVTTVTISGSGLIDEVRLHPKAANMMTYTYEPMIGITSTADANNTIAYSEYDNLARLKLLRDKDKNIIKRFDYSDTSMFLFIGQQPSWQGTSRNCTGNGASVDSVFIDVNPFSDSSGTTKTVAQPLDCTCSTAVNNPQFKVVNGQCEQGTWVVTSSAEVKINYVWVWRCTYRYCFSDGSQSTYYEQIIQSEFCPVSCFVEL